MTETAEPVTMDKIVSLSRRRGFVFPSSEIYGGLGSTYDYGHYGVLTKNNIRSLWLRSMVQERDDIVVLDSAIILNPRVWEASGHVSGFTPGPGHGGGIGGVNPVVPYWVSTRILPAESSMFVGGFSGAVLAPMGWV